ncbi:serine/threonine-protein kinase sepA-like isoform X2 [Glycine soja]|uniref:serine/threonine-protein kinase sepA-like isoform X2 n=1 Tax=Glycine soja TaxID=3848 RepID=UPI00103E7765|nr:serine/threonine-protein kinase sepA-like isoform X2 [Glycine soja]
MPLSRKPLSPSTSTGAKQIPGGDFAPARRLTRQRKLRHLTNQDTGFFHSDEFSFLPGSPEFRSHGGSDHRSFSALPQPLPLPEAPLTRRAKSISSGCVHRRRLSSSVEQDGFTISRNTVYQDAVTVNSFSFNPKIEEGSQNHKFLSRVCPENNLLDSHPLPLPPRASSPKQLSVVLHQSRIKHHATENLPSVKGRWQKGKLIGRGTFGSVFHATNIETGASCAMKEISLIADDPTYAECIKQLEQEIKILGQLHHPNIVQYYGSETVGNHLYIYMEYVYPGSISKFMREHCGAMTESVVRNFTRHILSGLAYLHSNKTIHRDIKGANLLVNKSGIVKLADFGLAKIPSAMFKVLLESPPIPETLSSVGKDFLQQCLQSDPADRPSAATLLKHAFVQNLHGQGVIVRSQSYTRGDLGQGGNSASPRDTTKNRRGIMQASNSTLILNKIQKSIGNAKESHHIRPYHHSHVPEVNILQSSLESSTLNCMSVANSRNVSTVTRMITNF